MVPSAVMRLTAIEARASGAAGAIVKSECNDVGILLRTIAPIRDITAARSAPIPCSAYLSASAHK